MDDRKPVQDFIKTVRNHLTDLDIDEKQMLIREAHNLFNKGLKQRQETRPHETVVNLLKKLREYYMIDLNDEGEPNAELLEIMHTWVEVERVIEAN